MLQGLVFKEPQRNERRGREWVREMHDALLIAETYSRTFANFHKEGSGYLLENVAGFG